MCTEIPQFLFFVPIRSLKREIILPTWECYLISTWTYTMLRPMLWGLSMQIYAKTLVRKNDFWQASCDVVAFQDKCIVSWHASQIWSTLFLKHDNGFSNPLQIAHMALLKRIWELNLLLQTGVCFENARRNPCNFTGSGQLSNIGTRWLIQTAIPRCYESRYFPWELWCF